MILQCHISQSFIHTFSYVHIYENSTLTNPSPSLLSRNLLSLLPTADDLQFRITTLIHNAAVVAACTGAYPRSVLYVLCTLCYILFSLSSVMSTLYSVLLNTLFSELCDGLLPYVICLLYCVCYQLYTVYSIICPLSSLLCAVYNYILYTANFIFLRVILYTL